MSIDSFFNIDPKAWKMWKASKLHICKCSMGLWIGLESL